MPAPKRVLYEEGNEGVCGQVQEILSPDQGGSADRSCSSDESTLLKMPVEMKSIANFGTSSHMLKPADNRCRLKGLHRDFGYHCEIAWCSFRKGINYLLDFLGCLLQPGVLAHALSRGEADSVLTFYLSAKRSESCLSRKAITYILQSAPTGEKCIVLDNVFEGCRGG